VHIVKKISGIIIGILGIILEVCGAIFIFKICKASSQNSVGIIGGADGPTAVFLVGRFGIMPYIIIAGAVIGATLIVLSLILLFHKKR
jgi:Na+-transporting methylmalonyl-CoA/oxaloacetate decarboxylase beta subunit